MAEIDKTVAASADDADETGDGTVTTDGTWLFVYSHTTPGGSSYKCWGSRWTGITIPKAATIGTAYMELYMDSTELDDMNGVIYGNLTPDAEDFADNAHIISTGDRPRTTASVAWVEDGVASGGTGYYGSAYSLTDIIQEIVNQATWASGNALVILIIANTDELKYCTIDAQDSSGYGAKLHIEYTASWTGKVIGVTNPAKVIGEAVASIAKVIGVS